MCGITTGRSAQELFFVDFASKVVRAFDPSSGQLCALDANKFEPSLKSDSIVMDVAYSAHNDTLFVCSWEKEWTYTVRSFDRHTNPNAWGQSDIHEVTLGIGKCLGAMCALNDGSLLLGGKFVSQKLHILSVDKERKMHLRASFKFISVGHYGFDATRTCIDIWLAVAKSESVELWARFRNKF